MKRRSPEEIRKRAIRELCANDTISVYTMVDDFEWRRAAPYPVIRLAKGYLLDSIAQLTIGVENFSRTMDQALGGRA